MLRLGTRADDIEIGCGGTMLTQLTAQPKVDCHWVAFGSRRRKRSFTADTSHGLLRLRGVEAGATEGLAEAFYARKVLASF